MYAERASTRCMQRDFPKGRARAEDRSAERGHLGCGAHDPEHTLYGQGVVAIERIYSDESLAEGCDSAG